MAYAGKNSQPNPEKQQAFLAEIAMHQEVPLQMLLGVIGVRQAIELNKYQESVGLVGLLAAPLSKEFCDENPEIAKSIDNNVAMYDDDIEDLIGTDPIVEKLLELPGTEERSIALRARRTIAALIMSIPASDTKEGVA